jgi:hypothetical protein
MRALMGISFTMMKKIDLTLFVNDLTQKELRVQIKISPVLVRSWFKNT